MTPQHVVSLHGKIAHAFCYRRRKVSWNLQGRPLLIQILGFIGIEVGAGNDLPQDGRLRVAVTEHRAFHFAALDTGLREHLRIKPERIVQRGAIFPPRTDFDNPHR